MNTQVLPEQLFFCPDAKENGQATLKDEEHRHCVKALRKQVGDQVVCVDGKGNYYEGEITEVGKQEVCLQLGKSWAEPEPRYLNVQLAVAPTKKTDKMEWLLEKAVEIGLGSITFVRTARTERARLKPERLQKTAISAMKQSKKAHLPAIAFADWKDFLQQELPENRFLATLLGEATPALFEQSFQGPSLVAIGPEGGFTEQEVSEAVQGGFLAVSLGRARLRTETAGLVACHLLNLKLT